MKSIEDKNNNKYRLKTEQPLQTKKPLNKTSIVQCKKVVRKEQCLPKV